MDFSEIGNTRINIGRTTSLTSDAALSHISPRDARPAYHVIDADSAEMITRTDNLAEACRAALIRGSAVVESRETVFEAKRTAKPRADHETDLSDWWAELTDPENEFGEVATGLFDVVREGDGYPVASGHGAVRWIACTTSAAILTGLWVESAAGSRFVPREWLMKLTNMDEIARVEGLVE